MIGWLVQVVDHHGPWVRTCHSNLLTSKQEASGVVVDRKVWQNPPQGPGNPWSGVGRDSDRGPSVSIYTYVVVD